MPDSGLAEILKNAQAFYQCGAYVDAAKSLEAALKIDPTSVENWYYRGVALQKMEEHAAAITCFREALAFSPDSFEPVHDLGVSLQAINRNVDALACFDKAVSLNQKSFEAYLNRGIVYSKLGNYKAELENYDVAQILRPDDETLLMNYGVALLQTGQFAKAVVHFQRVLKLDAYTEYARGLLLHAKMMCCDWSGLNQELLSLRVEISEGIPCIDPFYLLGLSDSMPDQLQVAKKFTEKHYSRSSVTLGGSQKYSHNRIRIAYLSADFHEHATAFLMVELFELHDKSRFDVIGISFGENDRSVMRKRLEASFETFIDVSAKSDKEIADIVRALEVDIAVDLKGYTTDARPGVFAYRPAPIQINYLGYPGTMGAKFIDYLIADQFIVPEDHQRFYAEKIVYLPGSYQPNDTRREIGDKPHSRDDIGLLDKDFVFCTFNNSYKITPQFFDIWMRLLQEVSNSVLWMLSKSPEQEKNLRKEAEIRGISGDRLIFAPHMELKSHLRRLQLADLFLDSLPYNAHTTTSDALWAGLPLVTCVGTTFAGRVAGSLLNAAGIPELITTSLEQYEQLALDLATNPTKLLTLRQKLKVTSRESALFDSKQFSKHLESAYITMWEAYQADASPAHIWVK
ncbi:TPR domain protein (plasmid) [Collimonas arenae]|uniref:protein O-GlcNAc transferase n=1 Tax=Collimonas arenae TaxID=279058 RepID=A0A0A1FHX8_9BURK|nr:tetratricopeptide repeat protein [Collimonas arenae]AIY44181.1 TPR domain protein [Collimonas arenae]